jgi:hypothetical protein
MNVVKKENKAMSLQVTEGLTVQIIPNISHEYLMTSKELATGYGVSYGNIREHMRVNDEFIDGKHFVKGVSISDTLPNAQPHQVFWTKRGIVRLGFFIKSKNAKLFRDWAEDLIINKLDKQPVLFDIPANKQLPAKRKHNRLTVERMNSILLDVFKIEDTGLRNKIARKLEGGSHV